MSKSADKSVGKSAGKSGAKKPKARPAERATTGAEVRDFLARNPDFLARNPDLLRTLTPPGRDHGDSVVDMQRFMVDRLQAEVTQLSSTQDELIATTRSNMSSQSQIHKAILTLVQASDLEHLIHTATHDFAQILDIEVITLSIERSPGAVEIAELGVYLLAPGTIDRLLGPGRTILLREQAEQSDLIFGPAAALVRSDALVRLDLGDFAPAGLFALGSREVGRFHPGQGTELLGFLARTVERCFLAWRKIPAR